MAPEPTWEELKIQKLAELKKYGKKARGCGELIAFLKGERVSLQERLWAYCYDCSGYLVDPGSNDCDNQTCPLYPIYRDVLVGSS